MAQTNILNTYIEPKPLWQDTHEFLQGLEHVTLVNETHTCMWRRSKGYAAHCQSRADPARAWRLALSNTLVNRALHTLTLDLARKHKDKLKPFLSGGLHKS